MKKSITIGVIIVIVVGFLFVSGVLEFNQENLDESLQNIPQNIKEVGETAQDLASETSTIIRESINQRLEHVQKEPVNRIVDDIAKIPKQIQEKNPLNEKPIIDKHELEIKVHQLTNQYRTQHELEPLSLDDNLSNVARGHSQDMALRDYFDHESPEGVNPTGRAESEGYTCQKIVGNLIYSGIGENIFQNNLYDTVWYTAGIPTSYEWNNLEEIAHSTVDGWMNSTVHRENILTSTFDREGIGVEIAEDDKVYITQNFCQILNFQLSQNFSLSQL